MNRHFLAASAVVAALAALPAMAKLPPPSDDSKAKAAETAAKAAHGNKVAEFQLCKSMDKIAAGYHAKAKQDGKSAAPAEKTAACADPGAFVYTPPLPPAVAGAAPAAATAVAAAPAAAVAAAAAPKK